LRVLRLLSQAIELNLLSGRGLNADVLKSDLARLLFSLEREHPAATTLENTTQACSSLQHYFRHLAASIESLASELSAGIHTLHETLAELSGEHSRGLERLEAVQRHMASQRGFDDVHALQKHFEDCLHALREEIRDQKAASSRQNLAVSEALSSLRQSAGRVPTTRPNLVFALLHLRRLDLVRERFGPALAAAMLDHLKQIVQARWPKAEEVSVVRYDSLLLLETQDLDLERHRHLLRRLATERLVYTATHNEASGEREHLLPLSFDWIAAHADSRDHALQLSQNFLNNTHPAS
jgi:hypothetical protein